MPRSPTRPPSPVLDALRNSTSEIHDRLEERFGYLMAERVEVQRYADHLGLVLSVHGPAERSLARTLRHLDLGNPREGRVSDTDLLRRDLDTLAGRGVRPRPIPFPHEPTVDGAGEAAGWLYVLEGARLGGAVIARHLARVAPDLDGASSFFRGGPGAAISGRRVESRWRGTLAWIERAGGDDPAAAVRGARSAFTLWEDQAGAVLPASPTG